MIIDGGNSNMKDNQHKFMDKKNNIKVDFVQQQSISFF